MNKCCSNIQAVVCKVTGAACGPMCHQEPRNDVGICRNGLGYACLVGSTQLCACIYNVAYCCMLSLCVSWQLSSPKKEGGPLSLLYAVFPAKVRTAMAKVAYTHTCTHTIHVHFFPCSSSRRRPPNFSSHNDNFCCFATWQCCCCCQENCHALGVCVYHGVVSRETAAIVVVRSPMPPPPPPKELPRGEKTAAIFFIRPPNQPTPSRIFPLYSTPPPACKTTSSCTSPYTYALLRPQPHSRPPSPSGRAKFAVGAAIGKLAHVRAIKECKWNRLKRNKEGPGQQTTHCFTLSLSPLSLSL